LTAFLLSEHISSTTAYFQGSYHMIVIFLVTGERIPSSGGICQLGS